MATSTTTADIPGTTPHPWADSFDWTLPTSAPQTLTPTQKAAFDRDGYVVVPDVVDPATLEELVAEIDALEAADDALLAQLPDGRIDIAESGAITFTLHPAIRSTAARAFAAHPTLVGLTRDLLGPDVNLYWDQAVYKKTEKRRRFPWHQDTGYTFVEPQHYLTCWVALTDATAENGCPRVLPGAHRGGTLLHHWVDPLGWECLPGEPAEAVTAEVPAGGALVFSSLTPHTTGPNTTDAVRKAYIVQYAPAGTRALTGDWLAGDPPTGSTSCDDPQRQPPVLRDGEPVPVEPLAT